MMRLKIIVVTKTRLLTQGQLTRNKNYTEHIKCNNKNNDRKSFISKSFISEIVKCKLINIFASVSDF